MRRACMALFLCFAVAFGLAAPAAYAAPVVIPPDAAPTKTGNTYAAWSAVWWQYVLSIPRSANPLLDPTGAQCQDRQLSGPVFFLVGSLVGPVDRDQCRVPAGRYIFFPLVNIVDVNTTNQTADELRAEIVDRENKASGLHANMDGIAIHDLNPATTPYRTLSTVFSVTLPPDSLFRLSPGTYRPAVADGYYLLLAPLPAGPHVISFGGTDGSGFTQDVTYHLTIQ